MQTAQFDTYARFYDLLYKDKKYNDEAEYIHQLISRHASKKQTDLALLDLACGTGKHLFELSRLGYPKLAGSDIASEMIAIARERSSAEESDIRFYNYSFQQSHSIAEKFDVVLSMFSAVNYITSFSDQLQSFRNINKLLSANGIFIFDYWNGNAVVRDYSPVKVLRKKDEKGEILRVSTTTVNPLEQSVQVKFNCIYFENDGKVDEFEELHNLHYYHLSEMRNLLEAAGFKVLHISPFMHPDDTLNPYDWNVSIVAQKLDNTA